MIRSISLLLTLCFFSLSSLYADNVYTLAEQDKAYAEALKQKKAVAFVLC